MGGGGGSIAGHVARPAASPGRVAWQRPARSATSLPTRGHPHPRRARLQVYSDFVRIALEVINLSLAMGLVHNEHLVYALLERRHVFAPVRGHETFVTSSWIHTHLPFRAVAIPRS